jgi:SIR2-like domain
MRAVRADYDFEEPAFSDVPLAVPLRVPALRQSVAALLQRRLIPLAGAGLSAGSPSDVPRGAEVAERLAALCRRSGLAPRIDALADQDDLGEVASVVEDELGRGALERELLEIDWSGRPFNLGHLAIALMYGEGLAKTGFTTNWDPLIRRAAETIAGLRLSCPCDVASLTTASPPLMVHLHGDSGHATTLVATSSDLARPGAALWTQPQLAAALPLGELLLIGFSVEPDYVLDTLNAVIGTTGSKPVGVINRDSVDRFVSRSPRLAAACGIDCTSSRYVEGGATETLGEAIRVCYSALIGDVLDDAEARARALFAGRIRTSGVDLVRAALTGGSLEDLLGLLWIAAYLPSGNRWTRQPTLLSLKDECSASLAVAMALASASDVTGLDSTFSGLRLGTSHGPVDLWIAIPDTRMTTTAAARASSEYSHRLTTPADTGVPLVLILARTDGLGPLGGHASLLGVPSPGTLTGIRLPVDMLTLDGLSARTASLTGSVSSPLRTLVRLP